jgi:hypothetical protein
MNGDLVKLARTCNWHSNFTDGALSNVLRAAANALLPTAPPPLFEYGDGRWQSVEPKEDDLREQR